MERGCVRSSLRPQPRSRKFHSSLRTISTIAERGGSALICMLLSVTSVFSCFIRWGTSFEPVFRAQGRLQTFKIFPLLGSANVLTPSRKNFGRFPPPVLCVPVGEGEVASPAVLIGRQIPPSVASAQDSRPAGRGHAIS